eukprot:TRINITY_DN27762_c0_g1_i1.p2 TRINITY_DN27762_c0_g1~~TRINITY_DN27762_c0_g1_i1.p2  ORF type:complete len:145 (+),score=17.50 TRINITY_DN27762_c0_g1_i1:72-506(+)
MFCFVLSYFFFSCSTFVFFFLMIRRPPRSTHCISSAASDVYKRQIQRAAGAAGLHGLCLTLFIIQVTFIMQKRHKILIHRRKRICRTETINIFFFKVMEQSSFIDKKETTQISKLQNLIFTQLFRQPFRSVCCYSFPLIVNFRQ